MKKIVFTAMILFLAVMGIFASNYSDIIKSAKENNISLKNAEISYLNSKLTIEKSELEDEVSITITGKAQVSPDLSITPTVTIVLPNDGSTTISATTPFSMSYSNTSKLSFTPSISVSHTFDLSGFDSDIITALSNSKSALQSEYSYQYSLLNFENSVISLMKSLINLEKNIENQKYSIQKSEKSLNDKLTLGQITTSSITYNQLVNQLELSKNTLSAYERQYENAKKQYKDLTGLEWEGVENLPNPDLSLNSLSTGNTNVIIKSIDVEIAKNNIEAKNASINPKNVKVNGSVSGTGIKNEIASQKALSASAGATYSSGNWSLGTSLSTSYNLNNTSFDTPSVTISGSWSNKTAAKADELQLKVLENNLISATNSFQDEYTSYLQSFNALLLEVMQYEFSCSQTAANSDYLKANLENVRAYYEAGLATEQELKDAEFNVKLDEYTQTVLVLDGLTLANKIKMLNL